MTFYNGDDAIGLFKVSASDTVLIDMFGRLGEDPGSGWDVGAQAVGTKEFTLVRKPDFTSGNAAALASFGVDAYTSEWMVYEQNNFTFIGSHTAGVEFSIRELNRYRDLSVLDENALTAHPLAGEEVELTVVITSNPKSSGNSTPRDNDDDGELDGISRIHVFVTDTAAISRGREGMSMQIVEVPNYEWLADREIGDVLKIKGALTFFFSTAQFDLSEEPEFLGSTYINFPELLPLLDPIDVTVDELNNFDGGELTINAASYVKYIGAYVRLTNTVASNIAFDGRRVDWAVNENGSRIYTYDLSLRFRNDRMDSGYLPGWNFRRPDVEGDFVAPPAGALVNVNGFLIVNGGNDPDGIYGNEAPLSINPFEDGGRWLTDDNGDPFYCINGEFCEPEGGTFEWINDLEILGLPPVVSNVALSDSTIEANQTITVTANAEAAEGTLAKVELIYTVAGEADTLAMTNTAGTEYSVEMPGFPDLTTVSFKIEATDDSGFVGSAPAAGEYSFFVTNTQITTIEFVQKSDDGEEGDSPLAGAGSVPADITATVVTSAVTDGFITIQDRAAMWSGIFVATGGDADALVEGDMINITSFEITENFGISTMNIGSFTKVGTNAEMDTLALTGVLTQDVTANYEPYEGVLVTFSDVKITTNQADGTRDFGEFEFGSRQGGDVAVDTLEAGEGLRYDDQSRRLNGTVNETMKIGATMTSITGVVNFSFGNAKLIGGNPDFFQGENFTYPDPRFTLDKPDNDASIEVTGDLSVEWTSTSDFDGNAITYTWVLFNAADTTEVVAVPSNSEGEDAVLTLTLETVDALLASADLEVGQSADFIWTVMVNAGGDTLAAADSYDIESNTFVTTYNELTLTRGLSTSNENEFGIPSEFALKQNYPNPFNPSTNINFALPQSSKVTLTVYDMLGRKVATLLNGSEMPAANHSVQFDASALASGMYIYRIEAGSFVSTRKMMLIK
ncbi:MAG: T9SS type A sorting domain-containing protein [Balneolaceae bacterium]|nr:T9SS type A sorting domain-containing protein [Balneolaceae bacterium]